MIQIPHTNIITTAQTELDTWQGEIDAKTTFPEKVEEAKRLWNLRNKKGNATFDEVKKMLTDMCVGARRCSYCEDSVADEVEHIHPKNIYPDKAFEWENYLYACGPCNGPKNNKFAIFRTDNDAFEDITPPRTRGYIPIEPIPGNSVLINPRVENPLEFLFLDIMGNPATFRFSELPTLNAKDKRRAEYTLKDILRLNEREYLVEAREIAFDNYLSRLSRYRTRKLVGANNTELQKIKVGIQKEAHPTVWAEMKRQYKNFPQAMQQRIPELWQLFEDIPEALTW